MRCRVVVGTHFPSPRLGMVANRLGFRDADVCRARESLFQHASRVDGHRDNRLGSYASRPALQNVRTSVPARNRSHRRCTLNAIKQIRKYLENNPSSASSRALAELAAALAEERDYPLGELY